MLVSTVSQLLDMSADTVPEAFKARVKSVYPIKTGNRDGKDWSLQKIILTDGGKTIECMIDGRQPFQRALEGQSIYCVAGRGERGLKGLKRKDNVWKDKTTPQIWIYDSAELTIEGNGSSGNPPPQPASQPPANNGNGNGNGNRQPAADNHRTQSNPPPPPTSKDELRQAEIKRFNLRLGRASSGLQRCYDAAYGLASAVKKKHADFNPSSTDIKEIATTLFIQTQGKNNNVSDEENFPIKPFESYAVPAANGNGQGEPPFN